MKKILKKLVKGFCLPILIMFFVATLSVGCGEKPPVDEGYHPTIDTFYYEIIERGLTKSVVKLIWETTYADNITISHYGSSDYFLASDGDTTITVNNGLHTFLLTASNEFFSTKDSIEFFVELK